MPALALRPVTPADVPQLVRLSAGRNIHASEYERFLALEGAHGILLEQEGHAIAATTVFQCFEHAVLGPVLAAAGADAVGASVALLSSALEALQRRGVTRVDAEASADEEPYLRALGFRELRRTTVWERVPAPLAHAPTTREMGPGDLLDVGALDAAAAGFGRKEYIDALRLAIPQGARVVDGPDGVAGFALLRRARRGHHVGPLVTSERDAEAAARLLRDAIAPGAAEPLVALAPEDAPGGAVLGPLGFERVGALVRMRAGERADVPEGTEWLLGGRLTG